MPHQSLKLPFVETLSLLEMSEGDIFPQRGARLSSYSLEQLVVCGDILSIPGLCLVF